MKIARSALGTRTDNEVNLYTTPDEAFSYKLVDYFAFTRLCYRCQKRSGRAQSHSYHATHPQNMAYQPFRPSSLLTPCYMCSPESVDSQTSQDTSGLGYQPCRRRRGSAPVPLVRSRRFVVQSCSRFKGCQVYILRLDCQRNFTYHS